MIMANDVPKWVTVSTGDIYTGVQTFLNNDKERAH